MIKINFAKMHGLGNDFVLLDKAELNKISDFKIFAANIADRRLGIGYDQLIIYQQISNDIVTMEIYNIDGSSALACGNATRCLMDLLHRKSGIKQILIKVAERSLKAIYNSPQNISVNMGKVQYEAKWMPSKEIIWEIASTYGIEKKEIICGDVGNPHIVIFANLSNQDQEIIGKSLQDGKYIPGGVNISFATIKNGEINLKVYERGVGFSLACGSAACVSFAVSFKQGYVGQNAKVNFKYGSLTMANINDEIIMQGPAVLAFEGEYYYNEA